MQACETLVGYAHFIGLVQKTPAAMMTAELVDTAVQQCIADGYLVDYLTERRAEVVNMMLYEWNAEEAIRMIQQEAIEEGLEEGRERGLKEGRKEGRREGREEARAAFLGQVAQMVADGLLTIDVATERFGFTEEELTAALGA
jgi:predicted transposase YdaD